MTDRQVCGRMGVGASAPAPGPDVRDLADGPGARKAGPKEGKRRRPKLMAQPGDSLGHHEFGEGNEDPEDPEDPTHGPFEVVEEPDGMVNCTQFSSCDEYGGEWGGWFMTGVVPGKPLSKRDWIEISHAWERYCVGPDWQPDTEQPEDLQYEWQYAAHAEVGAYEVATFASEDRGGAGLFVRHP